VNVNIDEIEADLPNGLHDALLRTFSSDPAERRAEFILDVWLGDLHSSAASRRECYRPARLELLGLAYLVLDASHSRYRATEASPVQIDACAADDNPERSRQVPREGFAGRFFVTEWNAFIHFAALDARLTWIEVN
jgi:hypothetical protein